MAYDVGDMFRFGNPSQDPDAKPFTNLAGVATDPTTVTLLVLKPDGTILTYAWPSAGANGTLSKESAGRFYFDVIFDQAGRWRSRQEGTGTVTAASEGSLKVQRQKVVAP